MRERKYNRILGYILAALILLSGMCLENTTADSSFAFIQAYNPSDSYMCVVEEQIIEAIPCTIEALGARTISCLVSEGRRANNVKLGIRIIVFLLCAESMIRYISQIKAHDDLCDSIEPYHRTVVLNYIHNTDGKK